MTTMGRTTGWTAGPLYQGLYYNFQNLQMSRSKSKVEVVSWSRPDWPSDKSSPDPQMSEYVVSTLKNITYWFEPKI